MKGSNTTKTEADMDRTKGTLATAAVIGGGLALLISVSALSKAPKKQVEPGTTGPGVTTPGSSTPARPGESRRG